MAVNLSVFIVNQFSRRLAQVKGRNRHSRTKAALKTGAACGILGTMNKVANPVARVAAPILALVLAASVWAGCGGSAPPSPASGLPTRAQPKLQTMKLWLGAEEILAELALTPLQQETGMMFRTNMDANGGMLFPLPYTEQASFWMTNCPLPLSAAYIDPNGVIQEIHELQAFNDNPVMAATNNIRFVLETPQGWFSRHNIRPGTVVRTERGALMKTFFQ
jgi:uncharacterized membrane protein (UPF0127 family)